MPRPRKADRWQPKVDDRDILERLHDRFTYCTDRWGKIRLEAKTDMRHVKGDPWPPDERAARVKAKRPVIALDELSQYENQVVNDVRANPRAIKFSPVGEGANDKTALFYGNKTREIEYRSHASQQRTRAFQNMVERSYGYTKFALEYVSDMPAGPNDPGSAFNKRLLIQGIPDPDAIYPDPDFTDAQGRDWKYLFEIEGNIAASEFKREFPDAEITSFSPELVKYSNGWVSEKTVRLTRYWELTKTHKTLFAYQVTDPDTQEQHTFEVWKDDDDTIGKIKAMGGTVIAERKVETPKVVEYRSNGVEILSTTSWPGKWIPYTAYFGKMLWMDDGNGPELVIMSMTRLARDPNMLHAYYTSCEAELIGSTSRTPWWVWKGSVDKKNALNIQKSNHEPVAFIEIEQKSTIDGKEIPSLPQRMPFEPPIQAIEVGKEGARRSIQAAIAGQPLPTEAQHRNEKSGVALKEIKDSGQRGSYHFTDSLNNGIEREGELIEDLLPKVHDTRGLTPIILPDGKAAQSYINYDAEQPPADLTKEHEEFAVPDINGLHAVTIDVGPEYASDRERQKDFVQTFLASPMFQAMPPQMQAEIMALLIKLENIGPIGEQIANLLSPPKDQQNQIPPKAMEIINQGKELAKALHAEIQRLESEKAAKVAEMQGKLVVQKQADQAKADIAAASDAKDVHVAQMEAEQRQSAAELQSATDLRLQKMEDAVKLLLAKLEGAKLGAELEQDTAMQERARLHTASEAQKARDAMPMDEGTSAE